MDFQKRLIAYVALVLSAFMLWNAWKIDHAPKVDTQKQTNQALQTVQAAAQDPTNVVPDVPQTPGLSSVIASQEVVPPSANNQSADDQAPTVTSADEQAGNYLEVKTDVLDLKINTLGGNLVNSQLLGYPAEIDAVDDPFTLLSNAPESFYQAQSGVIGEGMQAQPLYHTSKKVFTLASGEQQLEVNLTWQGDGMEVVKTYIFYPGQYRIDLKYQITNNTSAAWSGNYYAQLIRTGTQPKSASMTRYTYYGAAMSTPDDHFSKIKPKALLKSNLDQTVQGGWVAMLQHYFVSAIVPDPNQPFHFYSKANSQANLFTIGTLSPTIVVAPGKTAVENLTMYSGPAIAADLSPVAPTLKLTIDYGWFWFISLVLFWIMKHIYDIIGNWGWSIVGVTVIIKLVFYKLSAKSYTSMSAMKRLQPRIKILQERFKDDKAQLSKATMELYRKEKVNPLGGCLPLLVQIPVFIGLYWLIIESVQLRQAPFIFWIHDLAVKDPFYVLPVLMGISMFVQQKLSPPPPDPVQAKVMMMLPVVFTVFFLQFPAGLVLYWVVNNSLSILQQWYIMRKLDGGQKPSNKAAVKTKKK